MEEIRFFIDNILYPICAFFGVLCLYVIASSLDDINKEK